MHTVRFLLLSVFALIFPFVSYAEDLDIRIPVVDMRDFYSDDKRDEFLDTLYGALTTVGFFAVRHTGVDSAVIQNAYEQAQMFFKQDTDYKSQCFLKETKGQRGFVPSERAKGYSAKDIKEFYHIGRES